MERHQGNVVDVGITLHWSEDTGLCYADNALENSHQKLDLKNIIRGVDYDSYGPSGGCPYQHAEQ
jgi:hypothetical protein